VVYKGLARSPGSHNRMRVRAGQFGRGDTASIRQRVKVATPII